MGHSVRLIIPKSNTNTGTFNSSRIYFSVLLSPHPKAKSIFLVGIDSRLFGIVVTECPNLRRY